VLVARLFGVEGKGLLSIIMQVPGLLIMVLDLGITTSTLYFVSRGELRPGTAAANALVIAAALGVLGAPLIYALLAGPLAVAPGVPLAAVVIAVAILPSGLYSAWLAGISNGLSDLVLPLWNAIASSVATIVGLAVLLLTGHGNVTAVVGVSALGTFVGIGVFVVGMRRHLRPFRVDLAAARGMARFSAKAYTTSIAGFLHERQDVLLLGWLAGAGAVGLYSVGVSFAELTWYVPSALSAAILAKGSRRSEESAVDYTARTSRIAIVFMLVTVAGSLAIVPVLLPLVYGRAFAPAVFAFFALLPGVIADGVTRILWSYQTTRGRLYWGQALGTTVLNLAAVVVLVPILGGAGAGLASSVSYSVLAVLALRRFCADTGASLADVLVPRRADMQIIFRTLRRLALRGSDA
jgi:O-antigen/teichoic acid export membrane protein